MQLAKEIGVSLAHKKVEGPMQVGVELDTVRQTSRLPEAKLEVLHAVIAGFKGRRKATLHEFQQIMGQFKFAAGSSPLVMPFHTSFVRLW